MKLTQAFVKRVQCPTDKTKVEYCDDDLKGFLLDVRKSGGKTYYLRLVTSEGKRKYHRIADATILPLEVVSKWGQATLFSSPLHVNTTPICPTIHKHLYPHTESTLKPKIDSRASGDLTEA